MTDTSDTFYICSATSVNNNNNPVNVITVKNNVLTLEGLVHESNQQWQLRVIPFPEEMSYSNPTPLSTDFAIYGFAIYNPNAGVYMSYKNAETGEPLVYTTANKRAAALFQIQYILSNGVACFASIVNEGIILFDLSGQGAVGDYIVMVEQTPGLGSEWCLKPVVSTTS